jgi:hypothetical protein
MFHHGRHAVSSFRAAALVAVLPVHPEIASRAGVRYDPSAYSSGLSRRPYGVDIRNDTPPARESHEDQVKITRKIW